MSETLSWTGDGLMASHTVGRVDFTNNQSYAYASLSRRLTEERLNVDATHLWTNSFGYDAGQNAGPGVLTRMGQPEANGIAWKGGTDALLRINAETNSTARRLAYGRANGPSTIQALLDGQPMPVSQWGTQALSWQAVLQLTPGTHQLRAGAFHPSGQYTAWATNSFTNNAADKLEVAYDGIGQPTQRLWKSANGQTNRTQTLIWDAKGRLVKVIERDSATSGFNWSAIYDGLGRRLETTTILVTNGVTNVSYPVIIGQHYDAQYEFLELGAGEHRKETWKVIGPDLNGVYGGLNGIGGFEAIVPGPELFCPLLSDAKGNGQAVYDPKHSALMWYSNRVTGYGAVPGYAPLPFMHGAGLDGSRAWRNRAIDIHGLVWMGGNYYDPSSGRFIGPDPAGHDGSPSLYAFCDGDPINQLDPDGRFASAAWQKATPTIGATFDIAVNTIAGAGAALNWAAGAAAQLTQPFLGINPQPFYNNMDQWLGLTSPAAKMGYYDPHSGGATALNAAVPLLFPLARAGELANAARFVGGELNAAWQAESAVFRNAPSGFSNGNLAAEVHANFESSLNALYGTQSRDWLMKTGIGQTGVDATFIGDPSRFPGFKFGELKPYSQGSIGAFGNQLGTWDLPPGQTELFFYNKAGVIGSSGFQF